MNDACVCVGGFWEDRREEEEEKEGADTKTPHVNVGNKADGNLIPKWLEPSPKSCFQPHPCKSTSS